MGKQCLDDDLITRIEAIPEDAALVIVTVKRGNMISPQWEEYAVKLIEPFKEKFEGRIVVVPDDVTIEALDEFGILEKLAEISPDVVGKMLAIPHDRD